MQRKNPPPLKWKFLSPLISVMLTLIVLEAAARVASLVLFGRSEHGQVRLRYFPFLETVDALSDKRGPDNDINLATVLPGIVNPTLPQKKGNLRAVVIGASTARGLPSQLLAGKLEEYYSRTVEVINLAVPAYIVNQEVVMLGLFGLNLQPDLVISLDGVNDVVTASKTGRPGLPIPSRILFDAAESPIRFALSSIGKHSQLITLLLKWREREAEKVFWSRPDLIDATRRQYLQGLRSLSIIARGTGSTHLLVLQPFLHLRKDPTEEERNLPLAKRYDYRKQFLSDYIRGLSKRLETFRFADDVLFLDATSAFDDTADTCFQDEVHLTQRGYEILVNRIVEKLREHSVPGRAAGAVLERWPMVPSSAQPAIQVDFGSATVDFDG